MLRSAVVFALVLGASAGGPNHPAAGTGPAGGPPAGYDPAHPGGSAAGGSGGYDPAQPGGPPAGGSHGPSTGPSSAVSRCDGQIQMAIHTCWPWLKTKCQWTVPPTQDQMGECYIEHQSTAPPACRKAATRAFQCEHEKKSEGKCMERFGQQTIMACHPDIQAFCKEAFRAGFRPTFECMMRNSEQLSAVCKADAQNLVSCVQCGNARKKAMGYCMETFVKVCSHAKKGEEEMCYLKNKESFGDACQAAVSHMMNSCGQQERDQEYADHAQEYETRQELHEQEYEHRQHEAASRQRDQEYAAEDRYNERKEKMHHRRQEAARRQKTQRMQAGAQRQRMKRMGYELQKTHHMLEECHSSMNHMQEQYHREATDRMATSDRQSEDSEERHADSQEYDDQEYEATARAEVEHMNEDQMYGAGIPEAMHKYHDMPSGKPVYHDGSTTGQHHNGPTPLMTRLESLF